MVVARAPRPHSREAARGDQKFEAGAAKRVFGHANRGVGLARPALRLDDFDVGRRAGAKTDVHDIHDLPRLVGGGAGTGQPAVGARDRFARRSYLGPRLRLGTCVDGARLVHGRLSFELLRASLPAVEDWYGELRDKAPAVLRHEELRRIG